MTNAKQKTAAAADAVQNTDRAVAEAAVPLRTSTPVKIIGWASEIGDQPQMRALSGLFVAAGLVLDKPRLAKAGLRMLAAHEAATLAKNFVKNRLDRTRPRSRGKAEDDHKIRPGDDHSKEETSFPSGHSAGAAAVARAFAREFPDHGLAASGAAGFVALAQIPRCAHYPTDVGVGIAVGLLAEAAVNAGWSALAPEDGLPQDERFD